MFVYPLRFDALIYLICVAAWNSAMSTLSLGIVSWLGFVASLGAVIKYSYGALYHTAQGYLEPRETGLNPMSSTVLGKQYAVFVVVGLVAAAVEGWFGEAAANVLNIAYSFCIPASIMALAMTQSFRAAVNPVMWVQLISRIGWPYLLMCVFLLLLSQSAPYVFAAAVSAMPRWTLVGISSLVVGYFIIVMFHLMGYVLYQYHEALGYEVRREFESKKTSGPVSPYAEIEREIDILLFEGKAADAALRLSEISQERALSMPLHERYQKLLHLLNDVPALVEHSGRFITLLLQEGQGKKALDVYRATVEKHADFQPRADSEVDQLAELAEQQREYAWALRIMDRFAQRFPHSELIPKVYLRAARLMCEHKHDDKTALQITESLALKYPNDPMAAEIINYRDFLRNLVASRSA
jgi:hypothetical protein